MDDLGGLGFGQEMVDVSQCQLNIRVCIQAAISNDSANYNSGSCPKDLGNRLVGDLVI